ncbi:hypothetical protein [Winogradskyella alexanderae]|uniref:DUF4258 domain-containing protein n=1 Tax=Winogradskyella alexanderae TaxID=2877123 RepID=A0ABS7XRR6_9FLAO|nr:hypothetical protein [Winogradskyella alexanderae]MCA0132700.1 hypothetical protein [Winogradskyella alexanderae]
MKFIQRLGYYLSGFAVGLIILFFFLSGKKASCDYGPNARTVKNISSKPLSYSKNVADFILTNKLDSTTVKNLIRFGDVDFSKSLTNLDSCKQYFINNNFKGKDIELEVANCNSIAQILMMRYKNE